MTLAAADCTIATISASLHFDEVPEPLTGIENALPLLSASGGYVHNDYRRLASPAPMVYARGRSLYISVAAVSITLNALTAIVDDDHPATTPVSLSVTATVLPPLRFDAVLPITLTTRDILTAGSEPLFTLQVGGVLQEEQYIISPSNTLLLPLEYLSAGVSGEIHLVAVTVGDLETLTAAQQTLTLRDNISGRQFAATPLTIARCIRLRFRCRCGCCLLCWRRGLIRRWRC